METVSIGTTEHFRRPKRPHDAMANDFQFSHRRLPSPRPRQSPQLAAASSSNDMAARLRQRDREQSQTPVMLRRFIGDGLDLRRPANYTYHNREAEDEQMVIDLTSDPEEEQDERQEVEEERSTPQRSTTVPSNRAHGLPRFPRDREIIDLSVDSPPQVRNRNHTRVANTTAAETPEIEFVSARTLPGLPLNAQGQLPFLPQVRARDADIDALFFPDNISASDADERVQIFDLSENDNDNDDDDEVIYTGTAARDPATLGPRVAFLEAEDRRLRAERNLLQRDRRAAERQVAATFRDRFAARLRTLTAADAQRINTRRQNHDRIQQQVNLITRGVNQAYFEAPRLDFGVVGFNLGGQRETPPAPTYASPTEAPEGFTRSPEEKDVIICPNCEDELCTGKDEEKKQVWAVRACGHLYCGTCTNHRSKTKRKDPRDPKGKKPAVPLPPPFSSCVVDGCAKKVGKGTMIQLFL